MGSSTCCCGACNLRNGVFVLACFQLVAAFYSFILLTPIGLPGTIYPSAISVISGVFYLALGLLGIWATQKVIYEERNTAEQARRVGIYWWTFLASFFVLGILFTIIADAIAFQNIDNNNIPGLNMEDADYEEQKRRAKSLMIVAVVGSWIIVFPVYCYLLIVVWTFRKQIREGTYQEQQFTPTTI
eukprot:TRINITY_DN1755_c0_g1_i1.p2 TRINITY_DN1755_c0_g1~~TRINITY_DN1755_c0_g1_i1.p2  ORF type:complete len:186 (+),score=16.67 TRINITY_DN1755_c0_g1_i1:303-860(+)